MSYPLPLTRTEAYLAYKAGVIQQSELKPSLAVPRIGIDAWLAYWTQLANDYPKNPDGTPMILQEEEAYIAYLCGVLDTYPEKCLRRVGAYLRYIISARWGRPDHPLNREELYLSLIKTQFIPSGDPSSDIVIDGTAKAPFVAVKLYGDTFQQSYEGKNLFEAVPYSTPTQQGITTTITNTNIIHLEGTSDTTYANLTNLFATSLPAGTYTLSINKELPFRINLRTSLAGGSSPDRSIQAGETSVTFTTGDTITGMRIFIATGGAGVDFNETFTVQLVSGSTPDYDFEPYTGGTPSPNPEYPQPIQTVTGEQTVSKVGKNLFNIDNYSSAVLRGGGSAVSVAKENAITLKLTNLISQGANFCGIPIPNSDNLLGKSVTISGTVELGTGVSDARVAVYAGSSTSVGTSVASTNISASGSFTLAASIPASYPSGADRIHYVIYASGNSSPAVGSTVIYSNLQMEIGSATTYAPYSKTEYPISLGSIELCKLGSYQDYIWEDMGDWKIRKTTSRFTFETRKLLGLSKQPLGFVYNTDNNPLVGKHIPLVGKCSHFDVETTDTTWNGLNKTGMNSGGALWFMTTDTSQGDTRTNEEFGQWLVDAGVSFVYALETPTDTVITDQNLIDQLNALKQGGAEEGTTYIKVSAADPNLPGLLYVEAPKYD